VRNAWFMSAAIAALLVPLAGCGNPPQDKAVHFDGAAALGFVRGLALGPDGGPRFRMPGTPGQEEGAQYLWHASDVDGWSRGWQNFTGEDYLQLDRGLVQTYDSKFYCGDADRAARPGLPFHNLLAVKAGPAGSPVLMLAAHWDSQMDSNYDPDPAKRPDPDPGANDGASGVGVLLQLMHEVSARPQLPYTVAILFVDGEDGFYNCYALAGSLYYAQRAVELPDLFVLLDMVGDPGAQFVRETASEQSARTALDILWSKAADLGGSGHFVTTSTSIQDDHIAFIEQRVPSVDIIDAGRPDTTFPPQWDTTGDTVDKLDASTLALVGDVLVTAMEDSAFQVYLEQQLALHAK
jgi:hypothetical protein